MATEGSGFNPIAVLVHLVAIALGLYLGWIAMDRISPDLPDASVEPGVSSPRARSPATTPSRCFAPPTSRRR